MLDPVAACSKLLMTEKAQKGKIQFSYFKTSEHPYVMGGGLLFKSQSHSVCCVGIFPVKSRVSIQANSSNVILGVVGGSRREK